MRTIEDFDQELKEEFPGYTIVRNLDGSEVRVWEPGESPLSQEKAHIHAMVDWLMEPPVDYLIRQIETRFPSLMVIPR